MPKRITSPAFSRPAAIALHMATFSKLPEEERELMRIKMEAILACNGRFVTVPAHLRDKAKELATRINAKGHFTHV